MVLIYDGSSKHVAHIKKSKIGIFPKKFGVDDSFDVTKHLQQIKVPDLLHLLPPLIYFGGGGMPNSIAKGVCGLKECGEDRIRFS